MLVRLALSLSAIYVYYTALDEIVNNGPVVVSRSYGGQFQFLTILAVLVSLVQQVLAVLAALTGLRTLAILESVALQISAPLEVLISLLYWSLKQIDPTLVLDPRFAFRLDPALDRKLHLWPAVFQSILAVHMPGRLWTAGIVSPIVLFSSVAAGYWYWVHHTFERNGFFPYPLFQQLEVPQRIGLFVGCVFIIILVYKGLQALQLRHH